MRDCWRVKTFGFDWTKRPVELKVEYDAYAGRTTLGRILMESFPKLQADLQAKSGWPNLSWEEEYLLGGELPPPEEIAGLLRLLGECVSVCDDYDISHCLDLHRIPEENVPHDEWEHTHIGQLVFKGKYRNDATAANNVGRELLRFVQRHPAFSTVDAICAIPPSSQQGRRLDLPNLWVSSVASTVQIEIVRLRRTRSTQSQKNIEDLEERSRNQQGSMEAGVDVRSKKVLVLDDMYMQGDTMSEAARALRQGGAQSVFALCATKTPKGARGF